MNYCVRKKKMTITQQDANNLKTYNVENRLTIDCYQYESLKAESRKITFEGKDKSNLNLKEAKDFVDKWTKREFSHNYLSHIIKRYSLDTKDPNKVLEIHLDIALADTKSN
jgi:hypothetical protein